MPDEKPRLASGALLVRADGAVMLLHHRAGPFTGRWSMPLVGVGDHETAEDALARMLREMLHIEPGPFAFLDTIPLEGHDGDRFLLNTFSCIGWSGTPALKSGLYDEAVWVPPAEAISGNPALDLVPGVRDWIAAQTATAVSAAQNAEARYGAEMLLAAFTSTRGALIAAFDAIPAPLRAAPGDSEASPLDLLAHAADLEAYTLAEARRVLAEPGRAWHDFNEGQWADLRAAWPAETEPEVRARFEAAGAATRTWLEAAPAATLNAYADRSEHGTVQVGACFIELASLDRAATERLLRMALTVRAGTGAGRN